jgi:hypothetical protein
MVASTRSASEEEGEMTADALVRGAHSSRQSDGRLARWAVGLAAGVVALLAVSYAIFGVAYAIDGSEAIDDTWVGYLGGISLIGGLLVSLVALALAIVATAKHERSSLIWLPLSLFPALLVVVVIAETLWIE